MSLKVHKWQKGRSVLVNNSITSFRNKENEREKHVIRPEGYIV